MSIETDRERLIHILVVHYDMFRDKAEEAADLFLHDKTLTSHPARTAEVGVPDSVVGAAMKEAWDDICSDTGHHPDDITHDGRLLYYDPGHWSNLVAKHINAALAPPSPAQSAIVPPVVEVTEAMVEEAVAVWEQTFLPAFPTPVSVTSRNAMRSALLAALQAQHRGE